MLSEIVDYIIEDAVYFRIYIRFFLHYIPIFIPCLLGALSMDKVRKYRGEKGHSVSKKLILLSSMIVTFVVMGIDLLGVTENLRNEGLSIVIGFLGGLLSQSIMSAISRNTFVTTMCKEFIEKNNSGSLASAFVSAIDKESDKDLDDDESDDDDDTSKEPKTSNKSEKKT